MRTSRAQSSHRSTDVGPRRARWRSAAARLIARTQPAHGPAWSADEIGELTALGPNARWLLGLLISGAVVMSAIVTKELRTRGGPQPMLETTVVRLASEPPDAPADLAIAQPPSHASEREGSDGAGLGESEVLGAEPVGPVGPELLDPDVRFFDGRPVRPARVIWMTVTAYSPDERSCPGTADGLTSTMHCVTTNGHLLVAADTSVLPYGSMLTIPGYGVEGKGESTIVPVLDIGGAIKGQRLDLLFPTHEQALRWGVRVVPVTVWAYADGKPAPNPRRVR